MTSRMMMMNDDDDDDDKKIIITGIGLNAEKLETTYSICGKVKWCNPFEKLSNASLKC